MLFSEIKMRLVVVLFLVACGSAFVFAQSDKPSATVKVPPLPEGMVAPDYQKPQELARDLIKIFTARGDQHILDVELAKTPPEQRKGMMFRSSVAPDTGMLFLFDDEVERSFWMKNTWVPLDLIFIRADGVIRHIHEMAEPKSLELIGSNGAAKAVLEVAGGEARRLGLSVGDRVVHDVFLAKD